MNKPKLIDYVEVPKSTTTETNYNYKRYSIALENYIKHLESEVKKLNTPDVIKSVCPNCNTEHRNSNSNEQFCLECGHGWQTVL